MLILGLETSCDETAAAVVEDGAVVRSNVVWSQHELHERYRGVVPEIASRAHLERITPVVGRAIDDAGLTLEQIDAIAVGNRPGLIGSLLVGVSAAKALAWSLGKPLVGVDHVQAHLYAAQLDRSKPAYPALGLVVSGGHTSLYRMDSPLDVTPIGRTIDDAIGEAYDKAAVILNIPYPGGPNLDRLAQQGDATAHDLPRSLLGPDSLDFSFSGLKTSLLYAVRGQPQGRGRDAQFLRSAADLTDTQRADFAASFQAAAVDAVIRKLGRAVERDAYRSLIVGGGVSANSLLRRLAIAFGHGRGLSVHLPPGALCVDNAAMIAGLAYPLLAADRGDDLSLSAIATTSLTHRS